MGDINYIVKFHVDISVHGTYCKGENGAASREEFEFKLMVMGCL